MKTKQFIPWILIVFVAGIFMDSCKKQETSYEQSYLEVSFPRLKFKHNLYYLIADNTRSIEIVFSELLDSATVQGNIALRDHTGSLEGTYDIDVSGAVVWLLFHADFHLNDGWLYELTLSNGIQSVNRHTLRSSETIELRTTARPYGVSGVSPGGDTLPSNSIAVISDIHMGDARATAGDYCWFGKNKDALESFLDLVKTGGAIKQLVIQGDLFDEWIVPFDVKPFDPGLGVNNSREYFASVAESPVNQLILEKLRAIAADPEIDLVYIPGNHDMLLTQEILDSIIPGIRWHGDVAGLGKYNPVPEIVMEHGHR
ncbi:MAG: metallophosphoesterase [Bacteroidales bacterium]|nr:metallophosphoesterase [Bacteroidales bacterium]